MSVEDMDLVDRNEEGTESNGRPLRYNGASTKLLERMPDMVGRGFLSFLADSYI
jgi:hypothetical protein